MRICTLDPITLNDVTDVANAPFVMDGDLKIYFESEANKQEYLEIEVHGSQGANTPALKAIFNAAADSQITGTIN